MQASTSPGAPKLGRRTYVIDRNFQLKYTVLLVVLGAFVSFLFGTMMYLGYLDAQRGVPLPPTVVQELARSNEALLWMMAAIALLMGVALGLTGVLITHRVAGPVYVMSHYIQVLANGRYPMLRPLRKTDELKALFERFASAIEAMRLREADEAVALDRALAQLSGQAQGAEAKACLDELKKIRDRKKDATDRVPVTKAAQA